MDINDIARQIIEAAGAAASGVRIRQAVVDAIAGDGALTLRVAGSTTQVAGVRAFSSCDAVVGESVWVAMDGQAVFAIGRIGAPSGSSGLPPLVDGMYLKVVDGELVWTTAEGPQGPEGPAGPAGPQGPQGIQGPKGDTGAQGIPGPTGAKGDRGDMGLTGPAGSRWSSGTGAPNPLTGAVADWYLDDGTGDAYEKTGAEEWTLRDNLRGPQGAQGIQGIQGIQGPQGVPGQDGSGITNGDKGDVIVADSGATLTLDPAVLARLVPAGVILMWSGALNAIPSGWALCDGNNGTPNLLDRFIVGAGSSYAKGATGGEPTHLLTTAEMPVHSHAIDHDHPAANTGTESADHGHSGSTGGQSVGHTHTMSQHRHNATVPLVRANAAGTSSATGRWGTGASREVSAGDVVADFGGTPETNAQSADHSHAFSTGGRSAAHYHTLDMPAFTGASGAKGGDGYHENRPPYFALAYIMKL